MISIFPYFWQEFSQHFINVMNFFPAIKNFS